MSSEARGRPAGLRRTLPPGLGRVATQGLCRRGQQVKTLAPPYRVGCPLGLETRSLSSPRRLSGPAGVGVGDLTQ